MTLYFDIETEPRPEAELREICPPFDPDAVKTGNLKDAEKIAARIEEARAEHFANFADKAALSPLLGQVCAIGWWAAEAAGTDCPTIIDCAPDEASGLAEFWDRLRRVNADGGLTLCGFNTHGFDLPFLIKRSWIRGVPVPALLRLERDRFWPEWNIDLRKIWQLGDAQGGGKLDDIARALGVAGKSGQHGHEFGRLWRSTTEDRELAREYLLQDVRLCRVLHGRLQWKAE